MCYCGHTWPLMAFGSADALWTAAVVTCLKVLLIPAYHSTDFEVHRNWMAVTRNLPMSQWYVDTTSEWTLDYPPLFAWLERAFAEVAVHVDPLMVQLTGTAYASPATVIFQRLTVMLSDGVLFYSTMRFCRKKSSEKAALVVGAVFFLPGLLLVDHIHFQYNGLLLGLLLLSLALLQEGRDVAASIVFALLVCMKHLFAVAGPLYAVFLLRHFCWTGARFSVGRFLSLAASVGGVVLLAFGPFAYMGQIPQLLSRLFPFGRGLCHAFWASNFWALYIAIDKVAAAVLRKLVGSKYLRFPLSTQSAGALTGGLVGDSSSFLLFPQITPAVSLALVLLSMLPCLVRVGRSSSVRAHREFVRSACHVFLCAFLLGWHVHEKAALHFMVPAALLAADSDGDAEEYLFVTAVGTYALFPLLFYSQEYPIKILLLLLYFLAMSSQLSRATSCAPSPQAGDKRRNTARGESSASPNPIARSPSDPSQIHSSRKEDRTEGKDNERDISQEVTKVDSVKSVLKVLEIARNSDVLKLGRKAFLLGLLLLEGYNLVLHRLLFGDALPFLPLLLISTYCSIGTLQVWVLQLIDITIGPYD
eukprot:TRINITY_DN520_c1_g1_i1.p1 TRINITY_DN520_c1_g1~~TRINITY_DN520_c1_g1_i1.p1  ORF type:complete len:588 (-),score=53.31 TRINITY_DN520_c1_g1_i1:233-1996(-)